MEPVTNTEASAKSSRSRRRSILWIAFLGMGLLLGTVWATGFATSQTTDGTAVASLPVVGTPHTNPNIVSPYAGKIATVNPPLAIGWDGYWGVVAVDTPLFSIDLSSFSSGTYYAEVLVRATGTDWDTQQYKFELYQSATCDATTVGGASTSHVLMNVTTTDSYVSFPGLTHGLKYCIGVKATAQASDNAGTFLRRPDLGRTPTMPDFVAVLNASA